MGVNHLSLMVRGFIYDPFRHLMSTFFWTLMDVKVFLRTLPHGPIPFTDYVERRVAGMRWKNGWSCGFAIDVSALE